MEVIVFGRLTDILGSNRFHYEGITNTDQLKLKLLELYPSISEIPYALAVNNQIIQGNYLLQTGDTIALLPPFSGG